MSIQAKVWLAIIAILVITGLVLFTTAMWNCNWDITKLGADQYETNTYAITDPFSNIYVESDTADVVFVSTEGTGSSVACYERKNVKHSVYVKDDALIIKVNDTRKWYEHIGIYFGTPKVTLTLPQEVYTSLSVRTDTGDVAIPAEFTFFDVNISGSTGSITSSADASDVVRIKTSTGSICVRDASAGSLDLSVSTGKIAVSNVICTGDIMADVTTGKTDIDNVSCRNLFSDGDTGDITLKNVIAAEKFDIERDTGDVKFEDCDAAKIFIETDTGDVTGNFLTDKIFLTETDTGRIDVPKTVTGGRCEISTDTGDIKIR
jgi:DUF4097 and DUF4098 domain-containing protein YvlB